MSLRCSGWRRPGTRCDRSHSDPGTRSAPARQWRCSAGSCRSRSPGLSRPRSLTAGSWRKWTWTLENDGARRWSCKRRPCPRPAASIPSVRTRGCSAAASGGTAAPGSSGWPGWVSRTPVKRPQTRRYGGSRARKTRVRGLWSSLHLDTCPQVIVRPDYSTRACRVWVPEHRRWPLRYPAPAESIFCFTSLHRRQQRMMRVESLTEVSPSTPPRLSASIKRISFLFSSLTS